MDVTLWAAVITAFGAIVAASIGVLPFLRRRAVATGQGGDEAKRKRGLKAIVYVDGEPHHLLNKGGKNCRIEKLDGSPSFLHPTHQIFHDPDSRTRVTVDSI